MLEHGSHPLFVAMRREANGGLPCPFRNKGSILIYGTIHHWPVVRRRRLIAHHGRRYGRPSKATRVDENDGDMRDATQEYKTIDLAEVLEETRGIYSVTDSIDPLPTSILRAPCEE